MLIELYLQNRQWDFRSQFTNASLDHYCHRTQIRGNLDNIIIELCQDESKKSKFYGINIMYVCMP